MPQARYSFKIALLGDGAVGKTTLKKRFIDQHLSGDYTATIGADFAYHEVFVDNITVGLNIWDLAGQERFQRLVQPFFRGMRGAVLVYDVTRAGTFKSLVRWVKAMIEEDTAHIPLILVANKDDLKAELGQVPSSKGKEMSAVLETLTGFPVTFVETSALTGYNVSQAFEFLVREILNGSRIPNSESG